MLDGIVLRASGDARSAVQTIFIASGRPLYVKGSEGAGPGPEIANIAETGAAARARERLGFQM
jgi:hypothetical protein